MKVGSCKIAGHIVSFWLVRDTICCNLRATVIGKALRSKNWNMSLSASGLGGKVANISSNSICLTWPNSKLDPSTVFERVGCTS